MEKGLRAPIQQYSWGFLLVSVVVVLRVADIPEVQQFVHAERTALLAICVCLVAFAWYSIFSSRPREARLRSMLGMFGTVVLSIMIVTRAILRTVPGSHSFVWDLHYLYYYPAHHPWLYALIIILLYLALFMLTGMKRTALVAAMTLLVMVE